MEYQLQTMVKPASDELWSKPLASPLMTPIILPMNSLTEAPLQEFRCLSKRGPAKIQFFSCMRDLRTQGSRFTLNAKPYWGFGLVGLSA